MTAVADIAARLEAVRERIARACARAYRETSSVCLVLASKTQPPEAIGAAYQEMGLPVEAIAAFDRALRWNPSNTEALSNRLFAMNFLPSFDPVAWLAEHRAYERRVRVPRATASR